MTRQELFAAAAATLLLAAPVHAAVRISSDPTSNMTCAAGVCRPTAQEAFLNTTDLANMLATGDVKVTTGSSAINIMILSSFSWTSTHRLTLDANLNVNFKAPVDVAGTGAVTIVTNDGGTGGDLVFSPAGKLNFWDTSSSLFVNGKSYVLVKDVASLASGIGSNPSGSFALAASYDAKHDGLFTNSVVGINFGGTFEGLGHEISGLRIKVSGSDLLGGLFAETEQGSVLRDVGVSRSSLEIINPNSGGALLAGLVWGQVIHAHTSGKVFARGKEATASEGGLVAVTTIDGTISDSHADVAVSAYRRQLAGGLVGENSGTITNSYASGAVGYFGGGLVGQNNGGIANSHASGTVFSGGGLVGINYFGIIYRCYATGTVDQNGGGLVGVNYGEVWQSFATGAVNGTWVNKRRPGIAGGLIGTAKTGELEDSYALGIVGGGSELTQRNGGLIGSNDPDNTGTLVTNSYATGRVTGSGYNGGVIGYDAVIDFGKQNVFWDMDTTGIDNPSQGAGHPSNDPGLVGLTDAQLKSALPSGFDPAIWAQSPNINNGYPYLIDNPPPQ